MKRIRIIDRQFNLLADISRYESLIFIPRWSKVGEFELRINLHIPNTETLQKGNLIIIGSDTKKVCLIQHRELPLDESGKQSEVLLIKGPTLKGVLGTRLTVPPNGSYDRLTANVETIMKQYVTNNVVTPADHERIIEQIEVAPTQNRGLSLFSQTRYKNLADELESLSLVSGIGWFLRLDRGNQKWIFDVEEGRDLTAGQTENPPVIFSPTFKNLKSSQYVTSDLNLRNVAYVAGQGEGEARRVEEVGGGSGLDRYELFVDARDIEEADEDGDPIPSNEIQIRLRDRGNQALSEAESEVFFEAQILTTGPFKYEEDWKLGDIVTIQNKQWGLLMDARITEVKEVYQASGMVLEVVFGNSMPTLTEKIKSRLNAISNDIRK
ncbi:siphovirus ReqiPepy6 Gp37-like family protein [Alkalihalophilus pseudofirmus]|uniref:Siphovirus ReqiPepy6 Gp37-like family protein n=1 Tax=Alkalihalophilus pseudofirmus TaxID=79885 RepID=A0AAJ2KZY2_ALKPS|nr:siphovirus ReqiPepy6 Gp37-like family protein [Alkalihalophilus pseudofirmus]MDV2883845.1 siphovirus ReqiPepy6 Gp37-like family protein [Alkalihalophilus pseudofirmus]